jgi:RNA polymerase sigma factor (sigma-70 family)
MVSKTLAPLTIARGGLLAVATEGQSDRQLLQHFVQRHDEVAFEALVQRHGPMVLGLCRRILGNDADAEDAFQATFLVLARKASAVGKPELLAGWLFGVACRVARKARAQAGRRRRLEAQGGTVPMQAPDPLQNAATQELRTILDEELRRLPAKYQAPLVLCYLEGLTNEEAAQRLGWPTGSMSYRLARGRELLRARLNRRNPSLAPALLSLLVTGPLLAALPTNLVAQTARAAAAFSAAQAAGAHLSSPAVAALAEKALRSMPPGPRWKACLWALATLLLLAASAMAYGAVKGELPSWSQVAGNTSSCH